MKKSDLLRIIVCMVFNFCYASSQKDLSTDGTPSQSSTLDHYAARLAISGGPTNQFPSGSCSHTLTKQQYCWWKLTFPNNLTFITKVEILYRAGSSYRFAGFYLYVSNTTATSPPDGHLCYHHEGTQQPSLNQTIDCYEMGKHVIIYNERKNGVTYPSSYSDYAVMELCDVNIFGCVKTLSGPECNVQCPQNCIDQHCFPGNSTCVWGCKNGTGGIACEKYNLAWYGSATQNPPNDSRPADLVIDGNKNYYSCAQTSSPQAWLQVDLGDLSVINTVYINFRPEGAKNISDGHSLYLTNTSGSWINDDLLYRAPNPNNNFPLTIHQINPPGVGQYVIYVPSPIDGISYIDICELEVTGCRVGYYGKTCNQTCPAHCNSNCDLDTGECIYGCEPGWNGTLCNKECPTGTYGRNCVYNCHCLTSTCNTATGRCSNDECAKGWMGSHCNQECPAQRFGYNCNDTCHCIYSTCDRYNGICQSSKCQNGWKLGSCSKECDGGFYGEDCKYTCGKCLNDEKCDGHNGVCWNGCQRGWTGIHCLNVSTVAGVSSMTCDNNNTIYASVGTFVITTILCVAAFLLIFRFRQKETGIHMREISNGRSKEEEHYTESFPGRQDTQYDDITEHAYSTAYETGSVNNTEGSTATSNL